MFEKIHEKIKVLAFIVLGLGIIGSVIYAFVLFMDYEIGAGFAFLVIGPIVSYINSLLIYGFGELIEKASIIAERNKPIGDSNNQTNYGIIHKDKKLQSHNFSNKKSYDVEHMVVKNTPISASDNTKENNTEQIVSKEKTVDDI